MSLSSCCKCGAIVDTDIEPDFYDFDYKTKSGYDGHCFICREDIINGMSDAEQAEHERKIYG